MGACHSVYPLSFNQTRVTQQSPRKESTPQFGKQAIMGSDRIGLVSRPREGSAPFLGLL